MNFLDANKTKLVGGLTVVLGFIQAYPGLPTLLTPRAYAWVMFLVGALVVLFGFLNTNAAKADAMTEIRAEDAQTKEDKTTVKTVKDYT